MNAKESAAMALDITHKCGERGPMTMKARAILAAWLDGVVKVRATTIRRYTDFLMMVAKQ